MGSLYSHISWSRFPFSLASAAYMIFRGFPVLAHSIRPASSSWSSADGSYLQCLPLGGIKPLHSFPVFPVAVSPGACKGVVVYLRPALSIFWNNLFMSSSDIFSLGSFHVNSCVFV